MLNNPLANIKFITYSLFDGTLCVPFLLKILVYIFENMLYNTVILIDEER